jgi:hypothetical protein
LKCREGKRANKGCALGGELPDEVLAATSSLLSKKAPAVPARDN